MNVNELADEAGVNRDTLADWEAGRKKPQPKTVEKVGAALARLEEEMGLNAPPRDQPEQEHVVRFTVKGVYGAEALVVEGPVDDIAELEAAVDRIMRRIQGREDKGDEDR